MAVDENVSETVKLVVFDDIVGCSWIETLASTRPSVGRAPDRPIGPSDLEASPMIGAVTLVGAIKATAGRCPLSQWRASVFDAVHDDQEWVVE